MTLLSYDEAVMVPAATIPREMVSATVPLTVGVPIMTLVMAIVLEAMMAMAMATAVVLATAVVTAQAMAGIHTQNFSVTSTAMVQADPETHRTPERT